MSYTLAHLRRGEVKVVLRLGLRSWAWHRVIDHALVVCLQRHGLIMDILVAELANLRRDVVPV